MTPRLTPMQRDVITSSGHVLVDAGAGSGKTTTVVRALCHQLGVVLPPAPGEEPLPAVSHRLSLDQVAAITFTNAAAADLKRKLRAALRAGGHGELAQDVDAARIGTIHGFCGDLMREYALRGGMRPMQRLLTEGEARVLIADCAREALHAAVSRGDVAGLPALLTGRRLKDVAEWIATAAEDAGRLERWAEGRSTMREDEAALLQVAQEATALRLARLAGEGLTDFDHMLGATRDLLRDPLVRHAVQRRIRLLVIDEFQDVDPVQRGIAELIGGLAAADADPTRLILVGDPKQSIYRFRRADVTLWKEIDARFRAGEGRVLPLTENFRSKGAILGFVDHVIGTLLDTPVDEAKGAQSFEVRYAPLLPRWPKQEGDRAVELQVIPPGADGKAVSSGQARMLDATGTAQRIAELHAEGRRWSEMAILLAGWGDVRLYEDALRKRGVPFYVLRGEGFWETREILDCVLALRAIRDPADHVAVAGFLKGPFVGVRDETLLALAMAKGTGTFVDALASVALERPLLDRAAALLGAFASLRDRIPLAELVRRLLFEGGFIAEAALDADGAQRTANLRKLLRLATQSPGHSLGDFLREIQEARARGDQVAPEPLYRERGEVVTITSIHGAKGLEWPVVFWCDLVREVRLETARFCVGRDTFALASVDDDAEHDEGEPAALDRHGALKSLCDSEALAESYRLWYVAATRAKELLVLGGFPLGVASRSAPTPARRFLSRLGEVPAGEELEYESAHGQRYRAVIRRLGARADASVTQANTAPSLATPPVRLTVPAGPARLSATQLMTFARDAAQWRRAHVERMPFPPGDARGDAARAILTGQVVHAVLERLVDDESDVMALIEDALLEWSSDEDVPDAESEAGAAVRAAMHLRVDAAVSTAAWTEVAGAPGARRELWFTRVLADGSVITGALDVAAPARDGREARVLDVKTGPATAEQYSVQAAVYLDAVGAITGARGGSFALLTVPSGTVIPVPDPGVALVHELVGRLRASGT